MIESLRRTETFALAAFAACSFGLGFFSGYTVHLFRPTGVGSLTTAEPVSVVLSLQVKAASVSQQVQWASFVMLVVTLGVVALATLDASKGRLLARSLFVLSVLAVMAAISSAVAFTIFRI